MSPCPRCRAPVVPHARFCSECGNWIVATAFSPGASPSGLPPPPPVELPDLPRPPAVPRGALPASAASLDALPAGAFTQTTRTPHPTFPSSLPPPAARSIATPTQVRTLESGRPPAPKTLDDAPLSRTLRTVVDERPPTSPSRSLGRTPRPLGGFLISYQYEPLGTFWPLAVGQNLVGRAGAGRPDIDVGIADTTVSTEQALVDVASSHATIEDRGSRNGTQVNGRAIAPGVRVPVGHGDRVRFGSFETILVMVPYPAGA